MKIKTPAKRAYYPASPNEITRLLCWIPYPVLQQMVGAGQAPENLLEDHPDGLEIEVTEATFAEFGITLGVTPTQVKRAYVKLLASKMLPPSCIADGMALEAMAYAAAKGSEMVSFSTGQIFPEPEMTDGDDPMMMLRRIQ
ncbi:MAG: hypothetical protein E4H27_03260 [Anaerolineales bacterium]|nr:MAG: hypothetical protein E4H27_03260 [Anaerolineales bacterium]